MLWAPALQLEALPGSLMRWRLLASMRTSRGISQTIWLGRPKRPVRKGLGASLASLVPVLSRMGVRPMGMMTSWLSSMPTVSLMSVTVMLKQLALAQRPL